VSIRKQLEAAVSDCLVVLALPRTSTKNIKDFNFIKSGTRCAYNLEIIEKSVQYLLKAWSLLPRFEMKLKIQEQAGHSKGQ